VTRHGGCATARKSTEPKEDAVPDEPDARDDASDEDPTAEAERSMDEADQANGEGRADDDDRPSGG